MSQVALTPLSHVELAMETWLAYLGVPYRWGGDDPMAGFDCSGYVIEGLKAAGVLPREGDWTAAILAQRWAQLAEDHQLRPGCLLFWRRGETIGHVEAVRAVVAGEVFSIGASGGGSGTQTVADAMRQNAYVKIRPAVQGWVRAVDPFHTRSR